MSDSPLWGRRRTLLLSAAISAIADVALFLAGNFPIFLLGNLLMGLGIGLYWPATEAAIADLAPPKQRSEAFAITRLADSIGLSLGTACGGILLAASIDGRWLFVADGLSFLVFFGVIYIAIAETLNHRGGPNPAAWWQAYGEALGDRCLLVYIAVNISFTAFISQTQTTLPLYLKKFVAANIPLAEFLARASSILPSSLQSAPGDDLSNLLVGALFFGHILLMVVVQLPVARWLERFSRPRALISHSCVGGWDLSSYGWPVPRQPLPFPPQLRHCFGFRWRSLLTRLPHRPSFPNSPPSACAASIWPSTPFAGPSGTLSDRL